jgi:predicted Zn-dependent protease
MDDVHHEDARALLAQTLAQATADHVTASLRVDEELSTRFANNAITQNMRRSEATLHVACAFGDRVGAASGNDFSADGMRALVARAEAIAQQSAPDPEFVPPPEPQVCPPTPTYSSDTRECTPDAAASLVVAAVQLAEKAGLSLAGSLTAEYSSRALLNSRGHFVAYPSTWARYVNTAVAEDSSGWAASGSRSLRNVDVRGAAETAVRKAEMGARPRDIPPGRYTVVLEPEAVADLLGYFYGVLDAKAAHEGRTCMSGKEGTRIAGENVTVASIPGQPECGGSPIIEAGLPAPDVHWIASGILANLSYSRFWARQTGHAVTQPVNLVMQGGAASLEELIESTDRGILVTRFWYIRFVDPMKFLLTGMTRDGLYWIEGGKVRHGLRNMRFNDSPLQVLNAVEGMSAAVAVGSPNLLPALKVRDFHFTSGTAF